MYEYWIQSVFIFGGHFGSVMYSIVQRTLQIKKISFKSQILNQELTNCSIIEVCGFYKYSAALFKFLNDLTNFLAVLKVNVKQDGKGECRF